MSEQRPLTPMSEEEHITLGTLTRNVTELTSSVRVLSGGQEKLEKIVTELAKRGQLSLGNVAIFVSMAIGLAGVVVALNTMSIKSTIHEEVTPRLTKLEKDFYVRNTAQDIYIGQLWREQHGYDLPPYPRSE